MLFSRTSEFGDQVARLAKVGSRHMMEITVFELSQCVSLPGM